MKLFNKPAIALFSLVLALATIPSTAQARGSVHVDIPGVTIGWHDSGKRHKNPYKRGYRVKRHHRRHYSHDDDYYYQDYRPRDYRYSENRDHYYDNSYNDNYYYGGSSRRYRNEHKQVCPRAGYSRYYNHSRRCERHKGHYHCS